MAVRAAQAHVQYVYIQPSYRPVCIAALLAGLSTALDIASVQHVGWLVLLMVYTVALSRAAYSVYAGLVVVSVGNGSWTNAVPLSIPLVVPNNRIGQTTPDYVGPNNRGPNDGWMHSFLAMLSALLMAKAV